MPNYETLDWRLNSGVATITLNRPRAGNALTMQMGRELMDASICCDDDPEVRAVVLTGAGRMFCVGAGDASHHECCTVSRGSGRL